MAIESDMSRQEALDSLTRFGIVPTWDSLGKRVLFRSAVTKGLVIPVTRQYKEKTWPLLIKALKMNTKEDTKHIRDIVKTELRKQKRI